MTVKVVEYTNGKETSSAKIACPAEASWFIDYQVKELGLIPTGEGRFVWTQDNGSRVRYEIVSETKLAAMVRVLKRWRYRLGIWAFSDTYDNEVGAVKMMISLSEHLVGLNQTQRVWQMGTIADEARACLMTWIGTPSENVRWIMYFTDEFNRKPYVKKYAMRAIIKYAQKELDRLSTELAQQIAEEIKYSPQEVE